MSQSVYTVDEIAKILRVSEKTVYKLVHEHELPCVRVRGQIRITAMALDDYLRGGTQDGETTTG